MKFPEKVKNIFYRNIMGFLDKRKSKTKYNSQEAEEEKLKYYTASQWQLIWWRFRKHKLSIVGMVILSIFLIFALLPEFFAPYSSVQRNGEYILCPPSAIKFKTPDGKFSIKPLVYGMKQQRNPETLAMEYSVNPDDVKPLKFFTRNGEYKLFGILPGSIHLFGIEDGFVHLWGTDNMARDIFSRTIFATRTSLSIGILGLLIAFFIGLIIGGISGYFGGWVDNFFQRTIEFVRSIPTYPLWMGVAAAMPREWSPQAVYFMMTIILGFIGWTTLARRVRSQLMAIRESDFIIAAKLCGSSDLRIIFKHMIPTFISYVIIDLTISFPTMILSETSLSFLGLGLRPPVTSWGVLLKASQNVRSIASNPWMFIPAIFVILAVLSFSFVGDGLRDAADPYSEKG